MNSGALSVLFHFIVNAFVNHISSLIKQKSQKLSQSFRYSPLVHVIAESCSFHHTISCSFHHTISTPFHEHGRKRLATILWKCRNAYPNNVNRGTALSWIIKRALEKYKFCRLSCSQDIRWKLAALKSHSKSTQADT